MEAVILLALLFFCVGRAFHVNNVFWIFVPTVFLVLLCIGALVCGNKQGTSVDDRSSTQSNHNPSVSTPAVWL